MNKPTHTLNPNTGREITINGVRFWKLLNHGFKYDEELNQLYDKPLPANTPKYVSKSIMIFPNNHYMFTRFGILLVILGQLQTTRWQIGKDE